ncbi:chitin synthesis regulation, resistance to congo red-domain-containing protein [Aspergillus pseudotamarii]|uniref:Chitin synthesis regulation, resistance to congo red-domain-containing protein n=3 Tax=Aspergillus subgen. Circumdati TaxID=2720871 RepID=A0A5N7AI69_9EURO|nr:chitin synthesis regulation, resistance to congo red-domain-containing protein [Aspergillus pseudotamarii]XP_031932526.1 chitin synthesis regulation, resistance to congo red-domain-containing protein [Aspergillus caelatus]KAE8135885.1 chitin synthesis regulation, resistance to congo red-domain-containing protein [Aspergillus pseudotamarii]KAE8369445.1 chitin synthesis regulation, resistance to congo red-domain-containing protein [Aspergillus caelatus]KAE8412408.1 chitin synthesis regulation,
MGVIHARRECGYNTWGDWVCRPSSWYDWGRWVAFAVIVGCAFIIFFLFACYNARRRRTRGLQPHPGTAWLAGPPPYGQQHQHPYYADPHYQHQPPPQYTPQPQAYGYFGGQQTGIELQSPPNAYHNGVDRTYQPPPGPPPPNASKV